MKVIVTDVHSRKAFDVVNILERVCGSQLVLCAAKSTGIALPVIYGRKVFQLRSDNYENFESDFNAILQEQSGQELIYFPVSEIPTIHLYKYIKTHDTSNLKYLLPDEQSFNLTRDKKVFQSFCEENGFPLPASYTKEDFGSIRKDFHPLLIKPRIGAGSVGIKHVNAYEDMDSLAAVNFEEYLVQRKIMAGNDVSGAFFLCQAGEVVSSYTHQRIRTFPKVGGVTVLSKSTCNPEIIKIGSALLSRLGWNGFAMIEFMFDPECKRWKIIELNPRLWGSVILSEFVGARFMQGYIDLCTGTRIEKCNATEKRYVRWLFPFEFIALLKGQVGIREFFRYFNSETCYINMTYSSFFRAFLYWFYLTFNLSSLKRFFKKLSV